MIRRIVTLERRMFKKTRDHGEVFPGWWYGFSYYDFSRDREVWYPMPLNWLIRWFRPISRRWNKVQIQGIRIDRALREITSGLLVEEMVRLELVLQEMRYKAMYDIVCRDGVDDATARKRLDEKIAWAKLSVCDDNEWGWRVRRAINCDPNFEWLGELNNLIAKGEGG